MEHKIHHEVHEEREVIFLFSTKNSKPFMNPMVQTIFVFIGVHSWFSLAERLLLP